MFNSFLTKAKNLQQKAHFIFGRVNWINIRSTCKK